GTPAEDLRRGTGRRDARRRGSRATDRDAPGGNPRGAEPPAARKAAIEERTDQVRRLLRDGSILYPTRPYRGEGLRDALPRVRLGDRPRGRDVPELRGVSRGLRGRRALRGMRTSPAEQVLRGTLHEFSKAAARRRDVAADHLARGGVDQDLERLPSIFVRREPDRRVQELRVLHIDRGARVLNRVDEVLQQLSLMLVDQLALDPIRSVLVDLGIHEPRLEHLA